MLSRLQAALSARFARLAGLLQSRQGPTPPKAPATEIRPLSDVRSHARAHGALIADETEIDRLIRTFGPIAETELEWKNSPCYPAPYIARLERMTVIPGSRVLLSDRGMACSDEIEQGFRIFGLRPKLWDMEVSEGPRLSFTPRPVSPQSIPCGIHLTGEHESNYFHWIVEVLPRLLLCELLMNDKHVPILVSEGLHDNLIALLDIVRAPDRPVLTLRKELSHLVEHLIYPADVARVLDTYDRAPGTDTVYLPVALLREMAARVKDACRGSPGDFSAGQKKRLLLRRNSGYRKLLNQAAIESMLVEDGFHPVDPENLTIQEQVRIFSQAETIVGASGACMANVLWCRPGARVVILHSDHPFKKYPYWDALGRASGAHVTYLAGARAYNVTDMFEAHDDFTIMPEDLARILKMELPATAA